MPGKVYCFNAFNEPMAAFNVSGMAVSSPPGGWASTGDNIYTPLAVAVPRARYGGGATSPVFPNDQPTQIRIDWATYTIQTTVSTMGLPNVSLNDDLILYFAVNQATLMTTRGFVLNSVPYSPAGMTEEGNQALQAHANPTFSAD